MENENSQSLPFLDRSEWDFSRIPENELEFAAIYEYCRECQYIKNCRQHIENWCPRGKRGGMISKRRQLRKEHAEIHQILNFIGVDLLTTKKRNLLDHPWKNLPEKIKDEIIIPADPIGFFELGEVKKLIEDEFEKNPGKNPDEYKYPNKKLEKAIGHRRYGTYSPAIFKLKIATTHYDILPLGIRKGIFSKKKIKESLNKFLDWWYDKNPAIQDKGRGHDVITESEANLHDLAVVRLRHHFNPKEIAQFTKFFPPSLKYKWVSEAERSRSRKRAENYYNNLFDRLSKTETMLSFTSHKGPAREGINKSNLGLE